MGRPRSELPLYPTEAQIAQKVLGPGRLDDWKALVVILESEGFPRVEQLFRARYWPACEMWFQAKHRLVRLAPGQLGKEDGVETAPEPKKRRLASDGHLAATVHKLTAATR